MPKYEVDVGGKTYEVDAPDSNTAWQWANYTHTQAPPPEAKPAPFSLSDTALSAAQSALGATKSTIEGITGAGSAPGEYLSGLQKKLGEKLTPERQAEIQRRSELEKKAAETGKPLEEIAAGLGGVKEAPLTTFAQAAGSSVPTVLGGIGVAALGATLGAPVALAAGVGIAAKYLLGAIQGGGEVKGTIYDAVKDKLMDNNVPEAEARRQATAAQDYMGKNWDTIAQGLGLGAIAGGTGAETELLKRFSKPIAKQIAAKEAAQIGKKAETGFIGATAREAGTEGLQGGQQQYAENVALSREGYATNALKGVYGAAARDAAMGAIGGGGIHAIAGRTSQETPTPTPTPRAEPGPQIAPEAPVGTQGTMFTDEEMGKRVPTPKEAPEPKSAAVQQGAQLDLGLDFQRDYADLVKERETLRQQPQTPEVKARVTDLTDQIMSLHENEVASLRAEKQTDAEARARFPAIAGAPEPAQQSLFPETEALRPEVAEPRLVTPPRNQQQVEARRRLDEADAQAAAEQAQKEQERRGGQYRLPLRNVPEGKDVKRDLTIPTRPDEITMQDLEDLGLPMRSAKTWLEQNVVGKTPAEIRVLVGNNPDLLLQKGTRAQVLKYLTAPVPESFKEAPSVTPITQKNQPKPIAQPRGGKPSVEIFGEPTSPELLRPKPRVPTPARASAAPIGLGLAPAGQLAGKGVNVEGTARPALNAPTTTPAVTTTATPAAPVARPPVAAKPAPKAAPAKTVETPAPVSAAETVEEETARKAEAEDVKRRLEALEKKAEQPAPKVAAPAPKAEKPATKEIPEKLREPVGTSEFGMEEGEKEILRGPQGMLFPMSKREEIKYAERKQTENDKKEEVGPAPKVDTGQMDLVFPETIVKAINGKTILEAANWGANNFPDADQRMIAMRVAATLRELQAVGVKMGTFKVTDEGQGLVSGAKGIAIMTPGPNNTPSSIRITVNHYSNGDQSGVDPEGVLHELVHAATMGAIQIGNKKSAANTRIGRTVGDLYDVVNAVFAHVDAKHARGETLNATEKKLRTPYMRDADEVLAWTLTNRDMQAYMETVPYKNSNLWTKFVESIRKVLGLTPKADTALSEILRVGGELTEMKAADLKEASTATGKQFSVSASTESLVDSMGPLSVPDKSALTKMVNTVRSEPDIDYTTKFRTQVADIGATIEKRLSEKFDGAVRDSLGKLNPMGLYRQAQDYTKMLLEYFQTGTLYKDPTTGLWMSGQGKGVRPPADVYALIDKYADKNGYSRDRATQIASRVLEGVRLDAMRTSNRTTGTNFLIHLKDNEIDQLVKEYNADPDLKEMSKLMDEARIAMVNNMVKAGRLSKEEGKAWSEVAGYVPFDRLEDFSTNFNKIKKVSGKGLAQVGKLPELVGSLNRPVGNVFDNYINTLGWMVGQTMKTDATVTTLRSLEDIGQANFLGRSAQGKPNVVGAYVDGEMMYWSVPSKYDVMAFKDLNPPKAGWLRNLGVFSNVLRKTVTVLPPFALKQVTDDVQRAILTSGVKNPGALIWMSLTNFPKLALAELRGIQHPIVREFGRLGLTGEYDFEAGKPATSLLKDLGYKKRTTFETILHRLDGITRASDVAVRKAIYDQTIKESGDAVLAQTRAREFINFRRRGASDFVGAMVTTIPFFNAYIQGMDVLYRAASGKDSSASVDRAQARRMFWSRAGTVMMLSSLYALGKDDDDEDYKNMDLRTRDSNWILPGGYKIPVPGELGAIFKVIPERIVEYMKRQGTPEEQEAFEAVRTTLSYMFEQYLGRAVPVPQAIKPVMEAWANKSFLTGRDLEGYHHKAMDPSARVTEQTSELAKAIAVFSRDQVGAEVSPIMIDNALRGYFGSSAAMLTMVTDSLLNPTRIDRPLHKYALLSNYLYDPVGTRRMTEFYEEREKVGKANTTLNELMKTDLDRAEKYAEAHAHELMMESAINSTLEQLERTRAYRKYLNSVEGAKDMSKEDREADLKEIKQMELAFVGWVREAKAELRKVQ